MFTWIDLPALREAMIRLSNAGLVTELIGAQLTIHTNLSGPQVAQIFKGINPMPTFVPIEGGWTFLFK